MARHIYYIASIPLTRLFTVRNLRRTLQKISESTSAGFILDFFLIDAISSKTKHPLTEDRTNRYPYVLVGQH